jgi:hypothetical protein
MIGLGLALGMAASVVVLRLLRAFLFGVGSTDPATLAVMNDHGGHRPGGVLRARASGGARRSVDRLEIRIAEVVTVRNAAALELRRTRATAIVIESGKAHGESLHPRTARR